MKISHAVSPSNKNQSQRLRRLSSASDGSFLHPHSFFSNRRCFSWSVELFLRPNGDFRVRHAISRLVRISRKLSHFFAIRCIIFRHFDKTKCNGTSDRLSWTLIIYCFEIMEALIDYTRNPGFDGRNWRHINQNEHARERARTLFIPTPVMALL